VGGKARSGWSSKIDEYGWVGSISMGEVDWSGLICEIYDCLSVESISLCSIDQGGWVGSISISL
jgi:hypothetical protein